MKECPWNHEMQLHFAWRQIDGNKLSLLGLEILNVKEPCKYLISLGKVPKMWSHQNLFLQRTVIALYSTFSNHLLSNYSSDTFRIIAWKLCRLFSLKLWHNLTLALKRRPKASHPTSMYAEFTRNRVSLLPSHFSSKSHLPNLEVKTALLHQALNHTPASLC